jgi:hypothetical protein
VTAVGQLAAKGIAVVAGNVWELHENGPRRTYDNNWACRWSDDEEWSAYVARAAATAVQQVHHSEMALTGHALLFVLACAGEAPKLKERSPGAEPL